MSPGSGPSSDWSLRRSDNTPAGSRYFATAPSVSYVSPRFRNLAPASASTSASTVYFDHNATTPLDPRVRDAMMPWLGARHGNPSSAHRYGQAAREAVEAARVDVAELIGGAPAEVIFTASGTEANNAVLRSAFDGAASGSRFVSSAFEHPSIEATAVALAGCGVDVVRVAPRRDGRVDAAEMLAQVGPSTRLVALMLANNELGTLQPVAEVARGCRERGVPLLCDAVQAAGKVPIDVRTLGVDYLVVGAHKFHGPLGAAALWLAPRADFAPLLAGGAQERRRRAGTENVPAIVGLGAAAAFATRELESRGRHLAELRDRFEDSVLRRVPGAQVHCAASPRLPNTSSVAFPGVDAQALLIRLDLRGYAVSTGAACASGAITPSRSLLALGLAPPLLGSTVRVSFGMPNTSVEVDGFVSVLVEEIAALRSRSEHRDDHSAVAPDAVRSVA